MNTPYSLHHFLKTDHFCWYITLVDLLLARVSYLATLEEKPSFLANCWKVATYEVEALGDWDEICENEAFWVDLSALAAEVMVPQITPAGLGTTPSVTRTGLSISVAASWTVSLYSILSWCQLQPLGLSHFVQYFPDEWEGRKGTPLQIFPILEKGVISRTHWVLQGC